MNGNFDIDKLASGIMRSSGGKITGRDIDRLKKGDLSAVLSALSEEDRAKLRNALGNKSVSDKVLSSKEAENIMKNIKGNGNNGRSR